MAFGFWKTVTAVKNRTDRQIDRQIDGQTNRQVDRQIDRQIDRQMFSFNYSVFDMFRTSKCSSSGRLVHSVFTVFLSHIHISSPVDGSIKHISRYSPTLPLTWALVGVGVNATTRPFYTRERHSTHCTGDWVGPRAGLDVCGKIAPREFDPRTTHLVASHYTD